MTKVCVFGAGAIGGFLAGSLHEAGANVSLVARGPHLEAILNDGLSVIRDGCITRARPSFARGRQRGTPRGRGPGRREAPAGRRRRTRCTRGTSGSSSRP